MHIHSICNNESAFSVQPVAIHCRVITPHFLDCMELNSVCIAHCAKQKCDEWISESKIIGAIIAFAASLLRNIILLRLCTKPNWSAQDKFVWLYARFRRNNPIDNNFDRTRTNPRLDINKLTQKIYRLQAVFHLVILLKSKFEYNQFTKF